MICFGNHSATHFMGMLLIGSGSEMQKMMLQE